jgi:hypothetical protein
VYFQIPYKFQNIEDKQNITDTLYTMLDFDTYRKDLRYYYHTLYSYSPEYVGKNFYRVLSSLGPIDLNDYYAFITIRLKGKSDIVVCNGVIAGLAFKISRFYWNNITKHRLMPFVGSIESVERRKGSIKDHIHMIIRIKELKKYYEPEQLEREIYSIASGFEEISKSDKDAVKVSIFQYSETSNELGNKIEYLCKMSSESYEPLVFKPYSRKTIQQRVRTSL